MRADYYECGICGQIHAWNWSGDCRDDSARFTLDEIPRDAVLRPWLERVAADNTLVQP